MFKTLFQLRIASVLVEAGGKLNGQIISLGLADKIYQFIAPKILGDKSAINAFEGRNIKEINEAIEFKLEKVMEFPPDILAVYNRN